MAHTNEQEFPPITYCEADELWFNEQTHSPEVVREVAGVSLDMQNALCFSPLEVEQMRTWLEDMRAEQDRGLTAEQMQAIANYERAKDAHRAWMNERARATVAPAVEIAHPRKLARVMLAYFALIAAVVLCVVKGCAR